MANSDYPVLQDPSSPIIPAIRNDVIRYVLPVLPDDVPLLYGTIGTSTPPWKMSARDSNYRDPSPVNGQTCANCRHSYQHVTSKTYIRDQIRPNIRPNAWCRLWNPLA